MATHLGRKLKKQKQETEKFNVITFIIFGVLVIYSFINVWEFISESTPLGVIVTEEMVGRLSEHYTIYTVSVSLMMVLGVTMVCYANQWESLYYTPIFIFSGMVIFYLLTGYDAWLKSFIYASGVIGLSLLFITGLRIKDNNALGLAVTFAFPFVGLFFAGTIPGEIINCVFLTFAIIFSLGYFKPFKDEEVFQNE
jgi:hypothetical protein